MIMSMYASNNSVCPAEDAGWSDEIFSLGANLICASNANKLISQGTGRFAPQEGTTYLLVRLAIFRLIVE